MAATARSFWKGHLRLALVTIPIRLVSATSSEDKIALHQVDRKSKQRIRYQKVAGETGKVVAQPDIVQGYELDDGSYVLFEPDELDKLKLETRHTVELTEFVDACSIDPLYFDNPYYVLPDGEVAEEGYRIIRDALRATKKYGVGQLTMRGRENLIAMKPSGEGLMLETLRYGSEVRDADDIFAGIGKGKLRPELIDMAKQLITERSHDFDPGEFKNHYAEALRKLVKEKVEGGLSTEVSGGSEGASGSGKVIDFLEALRRSTEKSPAKASSAKTKTAASSQKREPAKRAKPKAARSKTRARGKRTSTHDPPRRSARRRAADRAHFALEQPNARAESAVSRYHPKTLQEVPMHPGFAFWLWMMMSPRLTQRMLLGLPIGDELEAFDPFSMATKALSS